jgi:hypothetical protein
MWRSRARLGLGLGLGAIVVALAWPAVPAIAVAGAAQPDAGTLQVSPTTVPASTQTPLTLTFTAPAIAAPARAPVLDVTFSMPPGWTAIPPSSSDLACPNTACSLLQGATSTQFEVEVELSLKIAATFTLSIQATPPGFATSSTFTATEQPVSLAFATAPLTVEAPPVTVYCPTGGLGTMSVDPSSEPAATSMTYTFTYQAGSCGAGPGGVVTVTVPPNWTLPSTSSGTPGFVTWTDTPPAFAQGSMIVVPVGNLEPGTTVTFEYEAAQDPSSAGPYTFDAGQAASGEPSQSLVSSPTVIVTPVVVTTTTAPPSSPGTTTTAPPSSQGTTTTAPPSSQGTTTTAPPSSQGTTTTAPPSGQGTTTVVSPTPRTAHPGIDWRPILLVVLGLVLVAGTAALAAFRPPHRGGHGTAGGSVRAVPRTGPPPSVAVRDTGDSPALTVRIEPRVGATMTTIEERVP